jgi:hypothetical protein
LVRQRANGQFALMLKSKLEVKSMKIEEEIVDRTKFYYLSENRKFTALAKMVKYYKHKDLTENFNNVALRGVTLRTPYKEISYCFEGCRTFQPQSLTLDQGNLLMGIDIWSGAAYNGL